MVSPARRQAIISALRRGTVPKEGLLELAVGLDHLEPVIDEELEQVSQGQGHFKAIRGEYGSGKTFFTRWLQERALAGGFAVTEVQISETETPLHRLETIYRRLCERMVISGGVQGGFRNLLDAWIYELEETTLDELAGADAATIRKRQLELMEKQLEPIAALAPAFAAALRAYEAATVAGDLADAEGLAAWMAGQPNIAASIKRKAGIKGDVDHFGALAFLRALLQLLCASDHKGLVVILDEVETLQRVRLDVRDKGLNSLRQWIDEIGDGRFPGLFLVITGNSSFFDGAHGVQRLEPLAQRLATHFGSNPRFDNYRAIQLRLLPFDFSRLLEVGRKVRDLFATGNSAAERIERLAGDDFLEGLAHRIAGQLDDEVSVAPRLFLKKLVGDVLDPIELHADFDPKQHYEPMLQASEMTHVERLRSKGMDPDSIELDL